MQAKSLKLSSEARLMRGTCRVAGLFPHPQFPSSVSPPGCHLPPGGRLKTTLLSSTGQRPSGARGTTGRTDAPVFFPLSTSSRPPTEKGNCDQGYTKRLFFGGLGWCFFSSGKETSPRTAHVSTCTQVAIKRNGLRQAHPPFFDSPR